MTVVDTLLTKTESKSIVSPCTAIAPFAAKVAQALTRSADRRRKALPPLSGEPVTITHYEREESRSWTPNQNGAHIKVVNQYLTLLDLSITSQHALQTLVSVWLGFPYIL